MASSPASDWISQLRRGALELCVLCLLREDASYGYEIVTRLGQLGPLAAGENTIYPLLRRLKGDGQLETFSVDSPSGPPRQYYRLTAQGRRRLQTLEKEWDELARAVAACIGKGDAS
ncbi:MAG: PadR family transcriptional regulator [Hyphomonadaceae bacterium]